MINKRRKVTRHRGSHTHSRGAKKKARGSGHRGGIGMSGTGKRSDQKKTLVLNHKSPYFGKSKAWRKPIPKKLKTINLDQILKEKVDLIGYKILSRGSLSFKGKITASAASKLAIEKAKKSGSEIILPKPVEKKEKKVEEEKEENKE